MAELFAILYNLTQTLFDGILTVSGNIFTQVFQAISSSFFLEIIGFILIIGIFLKNFFEFIWELLKFIFWLFPAWFFDLETLFSKGFYFPKKNDSAKQVGFIPYIVRYIIVIAYSVFNLPKCILWYALDTLGWIIYLPFRFAFWTLDFLRYSLGMTNKKDKYWITDKEHEFWNFLDEIDYFVHGPKDNWFIDHYVNKHPPIPDPNSMNLGFHLIHFPDSVMEKCFAINPFSLRSCPIQGLVRAFNKLMSSATLNF
jgi:hypothetical protein